MTPYDSDMEIGEEPVQSAPPTEESVSPEVRSAVKRWLSRINCAKRRWEPDFKRMRENMEFCTGLQWMGQTKIDDERYINNLTLRLINQKVATLYAKDPKAVAMARERMNFEVWDENVDTLMEAINQAMLIQQEGLPLPPELSALFSDYQRGKQMQKQVERVGRTLKIVYQYQVDTQKPEFKEQLKQVVRRVITCGVAYGRPILCQQDQPYKKVSTIDHGSTVDERVERIKGILSKVSQKEVEENGPHLETLRSLVLSLGAGQALADEAQMPERIEFDFPCSTSIIPDERCRNLKGFVAARWLAQEYVLPVDEVNAIMGTNIKVGSGEGYATEQNPMPDESNMPKDSMFSDAQNRKLVALFEVWDYDTRTRFFVCAGWHDYVMAPEKPTPDVAGFWQHFSLVFNDVETEPMTRASIFPPSDVQICKSPQKEWNRSREALRDQRNANAPKYITRKGLLTENDKDALRNALPNSVIELEGVPPDQPLDRFIMPFQFAAVDPALYDTAPLEQDLLLGAGMQQANIGPAQPNVTATVGTIAEQSRLNVSGSNIDDLDGFLSCLAKASGELLLKGMSRETVKRIAGVGSSWPDLPESRLDFVNQVFLVIEAASSGRPNKAVEIANFRDIAPLMLQAGANPVGIVEEAARRMDDALDLDKFFPLTPGSLSAVAPSGETTQAEKSARSNGGEAKRLDMQRPSEQTAMTAT